MRSRFCWAYLVGAKGYNIATCSSLDRAVSAVACPEALSRALTKKRACRSGCPRSLRARGKCGLRAELSASGASSFQVLPSSASSEASGSRSVSVRGERFSALDFTGAGPDPPWLGAAEGEAVSVLDCTLNATTGRFHGECPSTHFPEFSAGPRGPALATDSGSWSGQSATLEKYRVPGVVSRGSEVAGGRLNAESSMDVVGRGSGVQVVQFSWRMKFLSKSSGYLTG